MKIFEAKPGRRAGVGNVGKAASQHPRRPRIAAPVQAQELAAARRLAPPPPPRPLRPPFVTPDIKSKETIRTCLNQTGAKVSFDCTCVFFQREASLGEAVALAVSQVPHPRGQFAAQGVGRRTNAHATRTAPGQKVPAPRAARHCDMITPTTA